MARLQSGDMPCHNREAVEEERVLPGNVAMKKPLISIVLVVAGIIVVWTVTRDHLPGTNLNVAAQ